MDREEFERKYNVFVKDAIDTGCPFLRSISVYCGECGNQDKVYFVAQGGDPCPPRKCGLNACRNYGKKYDNPDRLIIAIGTPEILKNCDLT